MEHETDEVLGTSSCVSTAGGVEPALNGRPRLFKTVINRTPSGASPMATSAAGATLNDDCGNGVPSAVDLFRYSAPAILVLDSSLSTAPGAYFSYDGGLTNGADGVDGAGKHYNTVANGDDYADFTSGLDCGTDEAVQDAEGCPGKDAGLTILNDGRGEINILNAVGYNLVSAPPELVTANKKLVDFGKVEFPPRAPRENGLELKNDGPNVETIGPISVVATYGDASQFTFTSECDTLDPRKRCHITLDFTPDAAQISRATLKIEISSGSTISIPLTGTGFVF